MWHRQTDRVSGGEGTPLPESLPRPVVATGRDGDGCHRSQGESGPRKSTVTEASRSV